MVLLKTWEAAVKGHHPSNSKINICKGIQAKDHPQVPCNNVPVDLLQECKEANPVQVVPVVQAVMAAHHLKVCVQEVHLLKACVQVDLLQEVPDHQAVAQAICSVTLCKSELRINDKATYTLRCDGLKN